MKGNQACYVFLAIFAVFAACTASQSNRTVAIPEINSSILVFGPSDYLQNGDQSRCQQMIDNALAYKQSRLMFVPTAFWVDDSYTQRKSVNSQGKVTYYCLNRTDGNGTTPTSCSEATQTDVDLLTSSMAACFQKAVNAELDISISPHMDDGLGLGGWRNGLVYDPLAKYGNWSYADFYLYPLADALAQAISPTTKVNFAMQGEMSATVVYYPESYTQLLSLLRARVLQNKAASFNAANIQVGVSTNFNKICGCVLQDLVDPGQYVALYPAAFAPLKSQFNMTAISELYNSTDFIGISSYPSLTPNFTTEQLEAATEQFDFEIGQFGVDLKDLIFNQGKPLFWNEYGVGGGSNQNGEVKATTAEEAAADPFFGVFGSYAQATDPWVLYDLRQPSPVRDYLHYFYNQTVAYAQQTGVNTTFQYIVSGIFLWNDASWDIQGVYPESTTSDGSYKDPTLVALFNNHNTMAMSSAGVSSAMAPVQTPPPPVSQPPPPAPAITTPPPPAATTTVVPVKPSATGTGTPTTPGVLGPAVSYSTGRRLI